MSQVSFLDVLLDRVELLIGRDLHLGRRVLRNLANKVANILNGCIWVQCDIVPWRYLSSCFSIAHENSVIILVSGDESFELGAGREQALQNNEIISPFEEMHICRFGWNEAGYVRKWALMPLD